MLTKEKALYQTKLIIDYLPIEEYNLIPKETIEYIENNFEFDKDIDVDPEIPLEKQDIDSKTYEMLNRIIKETEKNKALGVTGNSNNKENIRLNKLVKALEVENKKIPKIKELVIDYKETLRKKDEEIIQLKENNQILYKALQKIPKFIRKIFLKDNETKLLGKGK